MDYTGKIVHYLDRKSAPHLARVTEHKGKRLQITDQHGRDTRIPQDAVLAAYPAADNKQDLNRLAEGMLQAQVEIDMELLWTEVCEAGHAYTASDLAEIYFGTPSSLQCGALVYLLFEHDLRFERSETHFRALSPIETEARRQAREELKRQAEFENRARKWLRGVRNAQSIMDIPDEFLPLIQKIAAYFRFNKPNEASQLLAETGTDETPLRRHALDILVKTGKRVPDDESILLMAGIASDFPKEVQEYAATLPEFPKHHDREDLSGLFCCSIDDDETREVDDALSLEETEHGLRVGIHIADPAAFVTPGDPVDELALRRGATIYMPAGFIPLLPERISFELASLCAAVPRPALSFMVQFNRAEEVIDFRICRSQVIIDHRLNYEDADSLITTGEGPLAGMLQQLNRLSVKLAERRRAKGAMTIEKIETKVRVHDGEIICKGLLTATPSHDLVGEMMILANHQTAKLAAREKIPIIYRTQPQPDMPAAANLGKIVSDTDMNVFRGLKPGRLSLHPDRHTLLGLDAYTQITSPLRRYADLVLQRQLIAWLTQTEYPHSTSELFEVLGNYEMVERENRGLSQQAERYWQLEYLARHHRDDILGAKPVGKYTTFYLCALQPTGIRGKLVSDEHLRFGDEIQVRISELNPALGIIKLQRVNPGNGDPL